MSLPNLNLPLSMAYAFSAVGILWMVQHTPIEGLEPVPVAVSVPALSSMVLVSEPPAVKIVVKTVIKTVEVPAPVAVVKKPKVVPYPTPSTDEIYGTKYHKYAETIFSKKGLPVGLARGMLRLESKTGRLDYSKTGCAGWYQFCSKTRKAYGNFDPFDLSASTKAAAKLARDNVSSLKVYKVPTTRFHIYMAHMIGPKNAQSVWLLNNGVDVSTRYRNKMIKEIRSNWPKKRVGPMPKNSTTVAKKYYQFYRGLFEHLAEGKPSDNHI